MNKDQARRFARIVCGSVPNAQPREGYIVAPCPLSPWTHDHTSDKPHFAIKLGYGDSLCRCFVCKEAGGPASSMLFTLADLQKRLPRGRVVDIAAAAQLIAEAEEGKDTPDLGLTYEEFMAGGGHGDALYEFPGWWLDAYKPWSVHASARDYLAMRGVSATIADALDLRFDPGLRRVCVPVRDADGVLRGLHGRAIEDAIDPKYRMYPHKGRTNPDVWLGEAWYDPNRPVVAVEGYFDLTSVLRVTRNVVSPLFPGMNQRKTRRLADALRVVSLFDHGTAGDNGRKALDQYLPEVSRLHLYPSPGKDPGSMTPEELVAVLSPHMDLDELID